MWWLIQFSEYTDAEQCTSANSFVDDQAVFERLDISVGAVITSEDIPQAPGNAPPPPQSSYDEETEDNVCSVDEDKLCNTESSFFGERVGWNFIASNIRIFFEAFIIKTLVFRKRAWACGLLHRFF